MHTNEPLQSPTGPKYHQRRSPIGEGLKPRSLHIWFASFHVQCIKNAAYEMVRPLQNHSMQFGFVRRDATENMSHLGVQNGECGLIKHDIPELSALVLVFRLFVKYN